MLKNNKKSIKVTHDFLNLNEHIYVLCKNFTFYNQDEYNNRFNVNESWPGQRTFNLSQENPFLHIHLLSILEMNGVEINKYKDIVSHCHIRFAEDNSKDWAHVDPNMDTAIIYLSKTNLNSGTKFFNTQNQEIASIAFVQNTCVFFEEPLLHSSFGNHGDNIDNARMTLNIFCHK